MEKASTDQKLTVLQHQNQRLAVQLEEKRTATRQLEEKVSHYEEKEQDYAQTLLCINRVWSQLTGAISHLCTSTSVPPPKPPSAAVGSIRDPFLQRLVTDSAQVKTLVDAQKQQDAELTQIEAALVEGANSCKEALAAVLGALRAAHARQAELSGQLREAAAGSPEEAAALLARDNERLTAEAGSLRQQLDTLRALQASTSDQLRLAEDRQLEAEERIKMLQNELADAEQENSNIQKKYLTLKNTVSAGVAAATAGSDGGAGTFPPSVARANSITGPLPGQDSLDYIDEVSELQALLNKRNADLDREKEAHMKTKRELQDALARVGDESWVPSTRVYGVLQQQLSGLQEALAAKGRELEAVGRERDEAGREAASKASVAASEMHMRSKLAALERCYRELQFSKAESDRLRSEAEAALQQERTRAGSSKTVSELQQLVSTQQHQVAALQQRAKLDKASQERIEAAAREVVEASSRVTAQQLEVQRLHDALSRQNDAADEQRRRETALKERILDLQAFVDVLTTFCNDPRDVAEVRASEAVLREQVAALKLQLQGHELHATVRELEVSARSFRDQLDLMAVESDALRLQVSTAQRKASEVAAQLAHSRAECELYTSEIEATAAAFEEMQSQNARLLQQLAEKEEATNGVVTERLKLLQQVAALTEAATAARADCERAARELSDLVAVREALERDLARMSSELSQAKEQLRAAAAKLDAAAADAKKREAEAAALQAQMDALQQQLEAKQRMVEDAGEKQLKEKTKRQRIEEEMKALQGKLDRLKKLQSPAGVARELQEEIDAMRQLLNCNVCHERQKNVIITKCCHVFCDKCIKRNLEARNRKCPGCGINFSHGDVKNFFFT